jgi:hypothetical protein
MDIHEEAQQAAKLAYPDGTMPTRTLLEIIRDAYYRGYKDRARKAEKALEHMPYGAGEDYDA